jgi:hypothetical protein
MITARSLSHGRRKVEAACAALTHTTKVSRRVGARRRMSPGSFAIPEERKFPIHDKSHARMALQHLTRVAGLHGPHPALAKKVLAAVHKKWPALYACEKSLLIRDVKKAHHLR